MDTEKIRREPPVFEFGGEVTLVNLAHTPDWKHYNDQAYSCPRD